MFFGNFYFFLRLHRKNELWLKDLLKVLLALFLSDLYLYEDDICTLVNVILSGLSLNLKLLGLELTNLEFASDWEAGLS